jgi:osmotically-inducible protein OsmY
MIQLRQLLGYALVTALLTLTACSTISPRTCYTSMTDNDITTTIQVKIASDPGLAYQSIHVATYERTVTLSGTVENPTQADILMIMAKSAPNVKRVISHVIVRRVNFS